MKKPDEGVDIRPEDSDSRRRMIRVRVHDCGYRNRLARAATCLLAACAVGSALFQPAVAGDASSVGTGAASVNALSTVKAVTACGDLMKADVTSIGGAGSKITRTREETQSGVPVCTVEGTLTPEIGFRVVLPGETWTQRYLQLGCGGLCGSITLNVGVAEGCIPLGKGGFVLAATDMGHVGSGGDFGNDPQKRKDFAYRAQHLTAITAKTLIKAYYGQEAAYSYFDGCSDGGREAVVEAERFPGDFDGVIAGAPAMLFTVQNSLYHGWQAISNTGPDGRPILVASRLPILHKAVLAQCDALDGIKDGLIADPRACKIDLTKVTCDASKSAGTRDCLTSAEVNVARKFYDGPVDRATGDHLTAGQPQPGSELAWAGVYVPMNAGMPIFSTIIAEDALKGLIYEKNPPSDYTLAALKFTRKSLVEVTKLHRLYDGTSTDLSQFEARGGKLILWSGWWDPHISPINIIDFHKGIHAFMGEEKANAFERLYLLPGVYHCGGGEGPDKVDFLTAMMHWVETGKAPNAIMTKQEVVSGQSAFGQPTSVSDKSDAGDARLADDENKGPPPGMMKPPFEIPAVNRTRPVYPYPYVAKYRGRGNPNDAANFTKGKPLTVDVAPTWAGAGLLAPYEGARD